MLPRATHQQILDDEVIDANFAFLPFGTDGAQFFAEAFVNNSKVKKLNIRNCSIVDDEFKIISQAIIQRNKVLDLLNLDNNYLTRKIIPELVLLMEKKLVKVLCFYAIRDFLKNPDSLAKLQKVAKDNNIMLSVINPLEREEQYPTLFSTSPSCAVVSKLEEQKESSSNSDVKRFEVK